jgi:hypothetical protein
MSSKSHEQESQAQAVDRQVIRKAYSRPTLTLFGNLAELTQSQITGGFDPGLTGSKA